MWKPGCVVKSVAGHDKNRFYVVVSVSKTCVTIANGRARKLAKPKSKNMLHVQRTNTVLDLGAITTDKKLREALRPFDTAGEEGGYELVKGRCH